MGDTRKIVVESYPVDRLPDDLKARLGDGLTVRVILEEIMGDEAGAKRKTLRSFLGSAPGLYVSPEDAVEYIRTLRDESLR